jgi:hypothetical protein
MASIEQIQALIIENNKIIEKTIAKINNELLRKIADLSNPDLIAPIARRTRTITPVSDEERCTQTLVSGKNKGGKCSKKATVDSLCTMHSKKAKVEVVEQVVQQVVQVVQQEQVVEQVVEQDEQVVEQDELSAFMAHLKEEDSQ